MSRLKFLGVRAAGADIALFGGFATAFMMMTNGCVLWTMTQPEIAHDAVVTLALYRFAFGLGGAGVRTSTQSLHQLLLSFKRVGLHYIDFSQRRCYRRSTYPHCIGKNSRFRQSRDELRLVVMGTAFFGS